MSEPQIDIRPIAKGEDAAWGAMRTALWPDCPDEENRAEAAGYWAGENNMKIVLMAWAGERAVGFAEIGERSVVDSCEGPQAYLEGWYVAPEVRGQKVGARLIGAAEDWARAQGYENLASDVELDNLVSQKAHAALGFEETGRAVNYVKRLRP